MAQVSPDTVERVFQSNVSIPKLFLTEIPAQGKACRVMVNDKAIRCLLFHTPHYDFYCCSVKQTAYGLTYCNVLRITGQSKLV